MDFQKISSYLKTDLSYIIKGSSAMVTGQGFVSLIAFLSSITFANLLPKEAYGTYQYILTVSEFVMVISLTGLSSAVVRAVAQGNDGTLDETFKKNLIWSIGSVLLGIGISAYYFLNENLVLGWGILIASILTPLITSAKLYLSYLVGKKLFSKSSVYSVIGNLIPTGAVIVAIFLTDSILIILSIYFTFHAVVNLILHHRARQASENELTDPNTIPYAKHLSFQNIITRVAGHLDKILIFQFAGSVALAEYFFAISVPRQFQHFFKASKTIVLPKVSTRPFHELRISLPRKVVLLYLFIIPATILYVLLAPFIFKLFFPLYISSVVYSQLYALIFLFLPLALFQDALIGHAKHRVLYKSSVVTSTIKVITTLAFVPSLGILGALISVLLTQALSSIQIAYYFYKEKDVVSEITPTS